MFLAIYFGVLFIYSLFFVFVCVCVCVCVCGDDDFTKEQNIIIIALQRNLSFYL